MDESTCDAWWSICANLSGSGTGELQEPRGGSLLALARGKLALVGLGAAMAEQRLSSPPRVRRRRLYRPDRLVWAEAETDALSRQSPAFGETIEVGVCVIT
jgi:hypothetical protein